MIKAIETRYAGCRFRSRLEAKWAVFFTKAGIPWEYEPEGFDIDGRWYLPDFRLPQCGTWIEVKPELPDRDTLDFLRKAALSLPRHSGSGEKGPQLLLLGPIPELHSRSWDVAWRNMEDNWTWGFGRYSKNRRPWWLDGAAPHQQDRLHLFDSSEHMDFEIADAYRAARAARFEHGERG